MMPREWLSPSREVCGDNPPLRKGD
jgi:hypothetical protein